MSNIHERIEATREVERLRQMVALGDKDAVARGDEFQRLFEINEQLQAERDAYASAALVGLSGIVATPEKGYVADGGPGLVLSDLRRMRCEVEKLQADRAALMAVLDTLLIEVEPFRYATQEEINRQVEAKKRWADQHNARCGNSNEMWFYSTEFRRSLESQLEPLLKAMREANAVCDRIEAEAKKTSEVPT